MGYLIQMVLQELRERLEHAGEKMKVDALGKRHWWLSRTPEMLDLC